MNTTEESALSLPIPTEHRRIAREFALEQPTEAKAESVIQNTLAVLVVRDYLEMMGIATNVAESDCWNPVMQICANIADLVIVEVGKLECRSLKTGESICYMPPEVWENRIGYAIVRIEEDLRSASILGMVSQVSTETIAIDRLEPIEDLCVAIAALQASVQSNSPQTNNQSDIQLERSQPLVNLGNWLQGIVEAGWQEVEALFQQQPVQLAWRSLTLRQILDEPSDSLTRRAKLLNLGAQSVALVVTISERDRDKVPVRLAIYPVTEPYLPESLSLKVLDETGALFLEARARRIDNYIQLQLSGDPNEHFSIQISLGEVMLTEKFTL
ncbi:DUF1822 family protein [Tumidithrix elongata RA019]|uniref:DUF1822 family protein n=1 Tax=Tumidithrix elongata BACA0141 TaxID=2716417 RepID=A0AAW9Q4M3_9CYAN|nr:DUF1822 family protein [Tumidithrix elongata RA019]